MARKTSTGSKAIQVATSLVALLLPLLPAVARAGWKEENWGERFLLQRQRGLAELGRQVCSGGSNPGAQCVDDGDCAGGGTCGDNDSQSVSGGYSNEASGNYSSVSGGDARSAPGTDDWAAGGLWQDN